MLETAQRWMDLTVPDNLLEHFPSEPVDVVVLCNVLEPYPSEVRRLVFSHCFDYLREGGKVIVVVSLAAPASDSASGLDMLFPSCSAGGAASHASPEELEEDLEEAGLDIASTEIVEAKTVNHTAVIPGEAPKCERHRYALLVARRDPA